jgi:hypothetical protein
MERSDRDNLIKIDQSLPLAVAALTVKDFVLACGEKQAPE